MKTLMGVIYWATVYAVAKLIEDGNTLPNM